MIFYIKKPLNIKCKTIDRAKDRTTHLNISVAVKCHRDN